MRLAVCGAAALSAALPAQAEMSGGKIKIGVLTDLSGPDEQNSGVGSVEAAKMAAEEFGNKINGVPVEIRCRRSPEQTRHRRGDRAPLVRSRRCRRGDRSGQFGGRLCGAGDRQDRQQGGAADQRRRRRTSPARRARPITRSTGSTTPTRSARPSARRCRSSARPGSSSPPITCSAAR